jgi:hypothetical protein
MPALAAGSPFLYKLLSVIAVWPCVPLRPCQLIVTSALHTLHAPVPQAHHNYRFIIFTVSDDGAEAGRAASCHDVTDSCGTWRAQAAITLAS